MENKKIKPLGYDEETGEYKQIGVNENLEKLKQMFPSVVVDGEVNFTALKEQLGDIKEVEVERYDFTWSGKQNAKKESQKPIIGKTLNYCEEESKNPEDTENLYIEGDNLEVMKLLKENYTSRIKMIYIDPPYNTDKDFIYSDKHKISKEESDKQEGYIDEEGDRLEKSNKGNNRYHANWLNMMYPRLELARQLLTEDGVIFISIDDNEQANLKKICDGIFGEDNILSSLTWQCRNPNVDFVSTDHEYTLIYAKNKKSLYKIYAKKEEERKKGNWYGRQIKRKYLNDKEGEYVLDGINTVTFKQAHYTYYFDELGVYECSYDEIDKLNKTKYIGHKTYSNAPNTFREKIKRGNIIFYTDKNGTKSAKEKNYNKSDRCAIVSVLTREDFKYSDNEDFKKTGLYDYFEYSKPVEYIKYFIGAKTKTNDLILDFFSGSATTAHAVMKLNAEDGGSRKYIMVQLPEKTDEKSEAYKAGYKNICEIGKERIRRSGEELLNELEEKHNKYKKDNENITLDSINKPLITTEVDKKKYIKNPKALDVGFKVFKVAKTNIKWEELDNIEDVQTLEQYVMTDKDRFDFYEGTKDINVVYELMIQLSGIPLSSSVKVLEDIGKRTYLYQDTFVICLEEEITEKHIEQIALLQPQPIKYIFRDSAFGTNCELKLNTIKKLKKLISYKNTVNEISYTVEFL